MNNGKKKSSKSGLIFFAVCAVIGGIFGFAAAKLGREGDIRSLFKEIDGKTAGIVLLIIQAAVTVVLSAWSIASYLSSCRRVAKLTPDDYEEHDRIEEKLNTPMTLSTIVVTLGTGLFGCAEYFLLDQSKLLAVIPAAVFLVGFAVAFILQAKLVSIEKKLNPEKRGSVWDMNFQKEWMSSCDEAQKQMIYRAGYQAFVTGNVMCSAFCMVALVGQFIFRFGIMPIIMTSLLWLGMNLSYINTAAKLERGDSTID